MQLKVNFTSHYALLWVHNVVLVAFRKVNANVNNYTNSHACAHFSVLIKRKELAVFISRFKFLMPEVIHFDVHRKYIRAALNILQLSMFNNINFVVSITCAA